MMEFSMRLDRLFAVLTLIVSLNVCWALNDEGLALLKFREKVDSDPFGGLADWSDAVGVANPCAWNGIVCSSGFVVSLNLKDLCLGGSIAPDIGSLVHLKSIVLRNNSFYGTLPEGIARLKELEVLDLGYNNLSGPLPTDLGNNLSLSILLLDHNGLGGCFSPEVAELQMLSEAQVDENQLYQVNEMSARNTADSKDERMRKLVEMFSERPRNIQVPPFKQPSSPSPSPSPLPSPPQTQNQLFPPPSAPAPENSLPAQRNGDKESKTRRRALLLSLTIGGSVLLLVVLAAFVWYRSSKIAVKPWATGLSGQLQKAFVTGLPKLNRPELETACEDFSNVIGDTSSGTLYKGTLSSGVEIAALSFLDFSEASAKGWSKNKESQFRNKIETLSKVNHKNFVNLLGFCAEPIPFRRIMVFEYAPNGTLFEHLHMKEAEHLDWNMRMRILMGIAYCLQHTHQLSPPITHQKLNSSVVYLTEDYAAKVSDFGLWDKATAGEMDKNPESNIYSFGVLIFELVTGQLPYLVGRTSGEDWASDYMGAGQPLKYLVDPTLESFQEHQLDRIEEVMRACVQPEARRRPEMRDITARLREVTGIAPDGAIPRISALWWAELEILSTEAN